MLYAVYHDRTNSDGTGPGEGGGGKPHKALGDDDESKNTL